MKTVSLLVLLAALSGCSAEHASTESDHTVSGEPIPVEEQAVIDPQERADPGALMDAIKAKVVGTRKLRTEIPDIASVINGSEDEVEAKWWVDSALNILFYETTWSSEHSSGTSEYHFFDNNLVAGKETNQYNDYREWVFIHESFKPVYGFSLTDGTEGDSIPYFLQEGDYVSKNSQVHEALITTIGRIRELSASADTGDSMMVAGDTINGEFSESERYTVRKSLLKVLQYQ